MARAKNLAEFKAKGVSRVAWNLGVCYGDTSGQIGFWEAGRLPIRPANVDSRLPMPGTGEYEWTGFYPFAEHPQMLNPKRGFIHTWNSKATTWMREGDDARIGATFRTYLGSKLADESRQVTLSDMRDINRKIFNAFGARDRTQTSPAFFAPFIREAALSSTDPEVIEAARLMISFNGLYEDLDGDGKYDNPGAPLWHKWLEIAPRTMFGPTIDAWWSKVDQGRYQRYQTSLLYRAFQGADAGLNLKFDYFNGRSRDAVITATIRQTIDALKPEFANLPLNDWHQPVYWKYLDPSRKVPERPALPHDEVVTRTFATLGLGPAAVKHHGGEGWVGMMDLNPKKRSIYSVVEAGGQSLFISPDGTGNPHLTDQLLMHANNEFKRIEMSMPEIKRSAVSATRLEF
jgi:acyl-homoserine lactone acylase PvdQ